jgi:hypothetical protein
MVCQNRHLRRRRLRCHIGGRGGVAVGHCCDRPGLGADRASQGVSWSARRGNSVRLGGDVDFCWRSVDCDSGDLAERLTWAAGSRTEKCSLVVDRSNLVVTGPVVAHQASQDVLRNALIGNSTKPGREVDLQWKSAIVNSRGCTKHLT